MPTTFVHGFLPTSCLWFSRKSLPALTPKETWKLLGASFVIGNLPDLDLLIAICFPNDWLKYHRTVGHNFITLCLLFFLGRALLKWACPKLSAKQSIWITALVLGSHAIFDAMGGGGLSTNHPRHGTPLLWPFSNWELLFPWRVFPAYRLSEDSHFLVGHVTSIDYWTRGIIGEFMASVLILAAWVVGYETVRFVSRLPRGVRYIANSKKDSLENVSPFPQSSRRYTPVRPSRRHPGGIQSRKGRGF